MGKKTFILVEGIADIVLIKDFIEVHYLFTSKNKVNSQTIEFELEKESNRILIYNIKGKNPDTNTVKLLKQNINNYQPDNFISIFDADDNFNSSLKNLLKIGEFHPLSEESIFLFPNNRESGDLEKFLENIVVKKEILECWNTFETCIVSQNDDYTIPAKKSMIHTYLEVLNPNSKIGKEQCKEKSRNYKEIDKWNLSELNIDCVKCLKDFLDKYLI